MSSKLVRRSLSFAGAAFAVVGSTFSLSAADTVTYVLDNVVLESGPTMFGEFTWTYDTGFLTGTGEFTSLVIPYTVHNETDLIWTIDVETSIEIVLDGSVHDDGVDITLRLGNALTPTTGADLDLTTSAYEIGGNGFHTGAFVSGSIVPAAPTGAGDVASKAGSSVMAAAPSPFRARTTVSYVNPRPGLVRLSAFDAQGRRVDTLVTRWESAGPHDVVWERSDLAAGVYFLRLETGDEVAAAKVVRTR
ncbi:MAG: T9SS type A sorting domain-containing protein [bacterium]